jgi:hypothetical protein
LERQMSIARAYKQRAEALHRQGKAGAALKSALQSFLIYPLDLANVRAAGSLFFNWVRHPSNP